MSRSNGSGVCGVIFLWVIIAICCNVSNCSDGKSKSTRESGRSTSAYESQADKVRKEQIRNYKDAHPQYRMPSEPYLIKHPRDTYSTGPLEIKTSYGGESYVIRLRDSRTRRIELDCFIPSGRTVTLDVPVGSYIINYMCGSEWYGEQEMFGINGACSRADTTLHIDCDKGYSITLHKVLNGNLHTRSISRDEF